MKKIIIISFLLFFRFIPSSFADKIQCPVSDFRYETETGKTKTLSDIKNCQSQSYKNILSGIFFEQRKILNKKINNIYKDHSNHPNVLSKKMTQELKISRQCFEQICQEAINLCKSSNASYQSEIRRTKDCEEKINMFFQVHLLEGEVSVKRNAERKQRSVFREKFRQIEGKMRQYFFPLATFLYNEITNFDEKFTNFTAQPS